MFLTTIKSNLASSHNPSLTNLLLVKQSNTRETGSSRTRVQGINLTVTPKTDILLSCNASMIGSMIESKPKSKTGSEEHQLKI